MRNFNFLVEANDAVFEIDGTCWFSNRDKSYSGMEMEIKDLNHYEYHDPLNISINPASRRNVNSFATNFNPFATTHEPCYDGMSNPPEPNVLDCDLCQFDLLHRFDKVFGGKGNYLGNIVMSTQNGGTLACFISGNKTGNQRKYEFVDLTGGNILAETEWDLSAEYLGYHKHAEEHRIYEQKLQEFKVAYQFETKLNKEDFSEELVSFNGKPATEEDQAMFEEFHSTFIKMPYEVLKEQMENEQPQDEFQNDDPMQ